MPRRLRRVLRTLIVAASLLGATPAGGAGFERGALFAIDWQLTQPLFGLRQHVSLSPYGAGMEARFALGAGFSAGLSLSGTYFSKDVLGAELLTASATATAHYYLSRSSFQPYVGVGVGPVWRHIAHSQIPSDSTFGLAAAPEVGVLLTLDGGVALNLSVRYEYNTTSTWTVERAQMLGVRVGFAFY